MLPNMLRNNRLNTHMKPIKNNQYRRSKTVGVKGPEEIRENWAQEVEILTRSKPDFFTSDEAKMKSSSPIGTSAAAYSKLLLSQSNNSDILKVHQIEYEARMRDGLSKEPYQQFLVVVGQFARLCVVLKRIEIMEICESAALLSQCEDLDVLKVFINYF